MRLVILGAGGHGQVVAELAAQTQKYNEIIFLDDDLSNPKSQGKCSEYLQFKSEDTEMYPAFGNNEARLQWEETFEEQGIALATVQSPLAYVSPTASIAKGCIIMPFAVVNTEVVLQKATIVNVSAIVDHGCVIEAGCHIAPGAIVKAENRVPEKTKVDSGEIIPIRHFPL